MGTNVQESIGARQNILSHSISLLHIDILIAPLFCRGDIHVYTVDAVYLRQLKLLHVDKGVFICFLLKGK